MGAQRGNSPGKQRGGGRGGAGGGGRTGRRSRRIKSESHSQRFGNKHFLVILINFYFLEKSGASRRIFCANYDFGSF